MVVARCDGWTNHHHVVTGGLRVCRKSDLGDLGHRYFFPQVAKLSAESAEVSSIHLLRSLGRVTLVVWTPNVPVTLIPRITHLIPT